MGGCRRGAWLLLIAGSLARPAVAGEQDSSSAGEPHWSLHAQHTIVLQGHPSFSAAYSGRHSLSSDGESELTITSTAFLGVRPLNGLEIIVNPELSGGSGVSGTSGVAGFPNGEAYRVGSQKPLGFLARLFMRATIGLSDQRQWIADEENTVAGLQSSERIELILGRFSLLDFFDENAFSHDPRKSFLNWSLMANGAWDYPADTRGYTWGIVAQYIGRLASLRAAFVAVPAAANELEFDREIHNAFGTAVECELAEGLLHLPATARVVLYYNHARMGEYRAARMLDSVDIHATERPGRTKWGWGLNWEHHLSDHLGLFARLGWNDGTTETWAFTEIDRTLSAGGVLTGEPWYRPDDEVGVAVALNGLSQDHRDYLTAGGYGFIIGDGALEYAPECITEAYYSARMTGSLSMAADYQFVLHPAYNKSRGPVHIVGLRMHLEI